MPHSAELMHRRERTDGRVVANLHVTREGGRVREDHARAHLAVVRDVGVGHVQPAAPDPADASTLGVPRWKVTELSEDVAVADLQARRLAGVLRS